MRSPTLAALAALALAACGGGGTPPSTENLHADCSGGFQCATGQQCLHYGGFAGQPLASCEIPCSYDPDCPPPLACGPVADGPTQSICH